MSAFVGSGSVLVLWKIMIKDLRRSFNPRVKVKYFRYISCTLPHEIEDAPLNLSHHKVSKIEQFNYFYLLEGSKGSICIHG